MSKLTYPSWCQRCQERPAEYWVIEQLLIPPALVCEECWRDTDEYRTLDSPDNLTRHLAVAYGML